MEMPRNEFKKGTACDYRTQSASKLNPANCSYSEKTIGQKTHSGLNHIIIITFKKILGKILTTTLKV